MSDGTTRPLAVIAIALGGLAPFAGSPFIEQHGRLDVERLSAAVAREEDHVDAVDLAAWIKDRKPGLRVIDVRASSEFDQFHIPTAENIPLEGIAHALVRPNDTVVLYSGGGAHAAQAWVFLKALGHERVFFLSGGLDEWIDDVVNPALAVDATPDERHAFERAAPLSRYFGGTPQSGVPRSAMTTRSRDARSPSSSADSSTKAPQLKRRGC
jgi:rhodanese-related sulfurtransferase